MCVLSGNVPSSILDNDVVSAEEKGKSGKVVSIPERLETYSKFFDPIKQLNLKTLSELTKKSQLNLRRIRFCNTNNRVT